jgi:hypothetical protein
VLEKNIANRMKQFMGEVIGKHELEKEKKLVLVKTNIKKDI